VDVVVGNDHADAAGADAAGTGMVDVTVFHSEVASPRLD